MQKFCLVIQVARVCTQFVEYHQSKKGTVNAYRPLANLETKVSQRYDLGSHHFIGLDLTLGTSQTSQIGLLKSSLWSQKDVNMLNKVRVIRPAPMPQNNASYKLWKFKFCSTSSNFVRMLPIILSLYICNRLLVHPETTSWIKHNHIRKLRPLMLQTSAWKARRILLRPICFNYIHTCQQTSNMHSVTTFSL